MDLRNKKVAVVGLERSGLAAVKLLAAKGARVSVTDCLDTPRLRENLDKLDKKNIVDAEIGRHTEEFLRGCDLVVVSPGVPPDSLPIASAKKEGIPVISEIELAFRFCPAPVIAITGTNGKTTVSTLVERIFRAAGRKCVLCGNIGNAFSNEVLGLTGCDVVVLEVSSFQLETIDKFKPKVAAVLNLSPDHLDRYADLDEYVAAKCRIFSNQDKEDWALLKADSEGLKMAEKTKARVLYFSKNDTEDLKELNDNQMAALAITSLFGIDENLAKDVCRNFKGIEHRLEVVAEIKGVEFINDSKATNVDSTLWALRALQKPVILIAGGKDKGSDFAVVREKIKDKVRAMVLLGEAKEKMESFFRGSLRIETALTLQEAVKCAFGLARSGDCVLLSPMCASFDMFSDYAERGRVFKQAVCNLS